MPTVLVTGSSRGLGLEFVRQYAGDGWRVIATCREPQKAAELMEIEGDVEICRLDVTDFEAIEALATALKNTPIDVLVVNAGVNPQREAPPAEGTNYEAWPEAFRVNTMAAFRTCIAFAGHVERSERKVIAAISSGNASIARNPGGNYVYRSTKAALNLCMRGLANEYADRGLIIVMLSPGRVRTDMGGQEAARLPDEAISQMRAIIDGLTPEDRGRFIHFDGADVPW